MRLLVPACPGLPFSLMTVPSQVIDLSQNAKPNSVGEWKEQPDFAEPPLSLEGAADHWNHHEDTDYYSQPGALFRLMTPEQQQVLFENTARSIGEAPREIPHPNVLDPLYVPSHISLRGRALRHRA